MKKMRFVRLTGAPEVVIAAAEQDEALPFRDTPIFAELVRERGNPLCG